MAKKVEHKHELLENPETLAKQLQEAETWLERHPKMVIGTLAAVLLAVGGYFGYTYYINGQNEQAQKDMFQAIYYFEADSLNAALNGDGNNLGFLQIIDEYGMTDAGNLANYYAGACYLKKGQFEAAILHLEDFHANDMLVQARAYSLIGDAYLEQQKFDDAASFYNKASNYEPNKFFTPIYLMKAALAYEKLNQPEKALKAYQEIIEKYSDSSEYQNALKFKARLEPNS